MEKIHTTLELFNVQNLINQIPNEWCNILSMLVKPYESFINNTLSTETHKIFPKQSDIFSAFKECSFENVKVVIIGQDCYHHEGQANGLCFSVHENIKCPPSLRNIFKELQQEYNVQRHNTNLIDWAQQGVLLLNTSLTVCEKRPGSHIKVWNNFTKDIVKYLTCNKNKICYLLWGDFAISFAKYIDLSQNAVFKHSHPSPLSRKSFLGCHHFKLCNDYLSSNNMNTIKWV
jgi:uracil-DNA glycosylase